MFSEGKIRIWDVETNEPVAFLDTSADFWTMCHVGAVDLVIQRFLYWNGKDKILYIWDYKSSNLSPNFKAIAQKFLEPLNYSIIASFRGTGIIV